MYSHIFLHYPWRFLIISGLDISISIYFFLQRKTDSQISLFRIPFSVDLANKKQFFCWTSKSRARLRNWTTMSASCESSRRGGGGGASADKEQRRKEEKERVSRTSLILWHAHQNDVAAVRKLLEEDPSLVNATDYDNRTPLHVAAIHGWVDIAKCLLQYEANVNAQDRWKNTVMILIVISVCMPAVLMGWFVWRGAWIIVEHIKMSWLGGDFAVYVFVFIILLVDWCWVSWLYPFTKFLCFFFIFWGGDWGYNAVFSIVFIRVCISFAENIVGFSGN